MVVRRGLLRFLWIVLAALLSYTSATTGGFPRSVHAAAGQLPSATQSGQTIPLVLPRFAQVVSGDEFSCGLSTTGGVFCWGNNADGQVGDGTVRAYRPVVAVVGLQSGVDALAAGARHACAILGNGTLRCWGSNAHGQVGNNARAIWTEPTTVPAVTEAVRMVALGDAHSCALLESGTVRCWGRNDVGQLGGGDTAVHETSVVVSGLAGAVTTLVAGVAHTCALLDSGVLQCWGENSQGQLGDGTQLNRSTPISVTGFTQRVQGIAAGSYHTCAILADQTTWCWGDNERGQLGVSTVGDQATPVAVEQLPATLTTVSLGRYHSCGLDAAGGVICWGSNNRGLLGDGTKTVHARPVRVIGLPAPIVLLAVGEEHSCVLDDRGEILCWGSNRDRQLGEGASDSHSIPLQVNPATPVEEIRAIVSGTFHTCLLTNQGGVQCWGRNNDGQLGNGTADAHTMPVDVAGLQSGVTALALGTDHTCGIVNGGVQCWGGNQYGQLGIGSTHDVYVPTAVPGLESGVTAIAAGEQHTCALVGTTDLRCWGRNQWGQLGNNTMVDRNLPVAVQQISQPVAALIAGTSHTCVQLNRGAAQCWGDNRYGQLGDGTTLNRLTPVAVSGLPAAVAMLGAGERHTCALLVDGIVSCWGGNDVGQLGNDSIVGQVQPVAVQDLAGSSTALAVGALHTCALNAAGAIACWGGNRHNQTGNGLPNVRLVPEAVDGLLDHVIALQAGGYHTCVLLENNVPRCWGRDGDGQLGSGIRAYSAVPLALSEAAPASIRLNYLSGQPGSYFTLSGIGLPYSSTVALTVNAVPMTEPIPVNSSGEFIVFLDTTDLIPGTYQLMVNNDPTLGLTLLLPGADERHVMEGGGTVVILADVTGTSIKTFYLPFIAR